MSPSVKWFRYVIKSHFSPALNCNIIVHMGLTIASLFLIAWPAFAGQVNLAPIGAHYPIFTYETDENPQNYMVAFVRLDKDCRIVSKPGQPIFDYYWLMEGRRHKPVHPLIRKGISKRVAVGALSPERSKFKLRFQHVKELDPKLRGEAVTVVSRKTESGCDARAEFRDFKLTKIFSEAKKVMMPPFRKVTLVRLSGVKGGREQSHTYDQFN
jgi:hypothetical protein